MIVRLGAGHCVAEFIDTHSLDMVFQDPADGGSMLNILLCDNRQVGDWGFGTVNEILKRTLEVLSHIVGGQADGHCSATSENMQITLRGTRGFSDNVSSA